MTFSFIADKNTSSLNSKRMTTKPTSGQQIRWWALATTKPAFLGCVVRIAKVIDATNVEVAFFDSFAGTEVPALSKVPVNLADLNVAWRKLPSTIASPEPPKVEEYALLFLTEDWLKKNAEAILLSIKAHPTTLIKFPFSDGGLGISAIREMADALSKAGVDPSSLPSYQQFTASLPPNFVW